MVHIYIQSTPCCNFFWEWGIGASIKEKILLSQDFYISNDGSRLNSLKNSRRSDSTLIINITESIINKEIEIDDLARKRYIFSNDVNRIRKHKNYFKPVLKECYCNHNKTIVG